MRKICPYGLEKIKQWEGLKTNAYQDSGGVWSIGYGHTKKCGKPFPEEGMKISAEQAEDILQHDLSTFEKAVSSSVKVPLNDFQFSALVSFCYNVGTTAFQKSTLLKRLNKGDYSFVADELLRWVMVKGKKSQGLINRRQAEIALWNKGAFVSSNYVAAQNNKNFMEAIEKFLPILASISGLGSFLSGNGPIQWAFAFGLILFFIFSFYFLCKNYQIVLF